MSPVIRRATEGEDEALCAIHDQEESPIASRRERLLARWCSRRSRTTRQPLRSACAAVTHVGVGREQTQLGGRGWAS